MPVFAADATAGRFGKMLLGGLIVLATLPASAQTTKPATRIPSFDSRAPGPGTAKATAKDTARDKATACAEYGAGFVRLEGTTTCIKMGGSIGISTGGRIGQPR
jgi:hypothetical protein